MATRKRITECLLMAGLLFVSLFGPGATAQEAVAILEATGVKGGVVVHLSCGDPDSTELTAALRANDRYLVHGLDTDPAVVAKAREQLRSLGVYGDVSVDTWDGKRLPYIDNFANLVVADKPCDVSMDEVMRVLAPNGVSYMKKDGTWTKAVKARPDNIDEWTHYLHDATNNAVAHDTAVGPPKHYQWQGSPRWSRHHDHMSSTSALVAANGRLFLIFDEGPKASILLPGKWFLTAKDAFNGMILWKRPIPKWHSHLWPLKSGPCDLPRRLVAVGDRVYVTLGIDAPVSVLDAATGETLRTLDGTKGTEEILVCDGTLFLVIGTPQARDDLATMGEIRKRQATESCGGANRTIVAMEAETGRVLWKKPTDVVPITLAVAGQRVFFYDGEKVICLNRENAEQLWASAPLPRPEMFRSEFSPTLVVYKDVVLFAGAENMVRHRGAQNTMQALSVADGKLLWDVEHPPTGHDCPEDVLVAAGLVWTGAIADGQDSGEFTGRDPKTGEVRQHYIPKQKRGGGHHRCYRAKATDRYILTSRSGIEFLDVNAKDWSSYPWIRGACLYGIMPANGLIYTPPHDCACSIESKLWAFCAVAPESTTWTPPKEVSDEGRLEKGPAYSEVSPAETRDQGSEVRNEEEWPIYRHDTRRSGCTKTSVATELADVWQAELGGKLSSPVVAGGKVFVASVDTHTVHALDAGSGEKVWSYTAGGRVDSAPTIWQGRVLFGSADGWVYCLRAGDGQLVWRFRAAPEDRRMLAFEQVESLWPVSGSVLVEGGAVYAVAGRNAYLDGGMRLLRLDAKTGKKLSETLLDERSQGGKKGQVAQPDILSSDGRHVYMKSLKFSMDGACEGIPTRDVTKQYAEDAHLFCPTSFLDDTWWHRSYWVYGRVYRAGAIGYYLAGLMAPSGRILSVGQNAVYGFGRKDKYYRWTTPIEHVLFSAEKERGEFEPLGRRGRTTSIEATPSDSLNPGSKPTTVEAWVLSETGAGVVLARGGGKMDGMALLMETGKPCFVVRTGKELTTVSAKKSAVNRWVHLAGVLAADGKLELYVDGTLVGTAKAPRRPKLGPKASIDIGLDTRGGVGDYRAPFGFRGLMDEVRVYDGVLTADEIRRHAAQPEDATAAATLVLHYTFDKDKMNPRGEGKITDRSGKGNDGATVGLRSNVGKVGRAGKFIGAKPGILKLPFAVKHRWAQGIPFLVRAMVLADKTLFVAGPPDLLDEETVVRSLTDPKSRAVLVEQSDALDGKKGALLWAVSSGDGAKLMERKLDAMPVFDGMIAANNRLYLSTVDGTVMCMAGK